MTRRRLVEAAIAALARRGGCHAAVPMVPTTYGVCATTNVPAGRIVRTDCSWSGVQPELDVWDWTGPDAIYQRCWNAGATWLPIACYGTPWACNGEVMAAPLPEHVFDYAAFCAAIASRYPVIAGIELWNEPNLQMFGALPPAVYAQLVNTATPMIRKVRPLLPVLVGAVADAGTRTPWEHYLADVVRRTNPAVVSAHCYLGPHNIARARKIVGEHRQLWVTETGISANNPEADRLKYMRQVKAECERERVRVALAYSWDDPAWLPSRRLAREWLGTGRAAL